MKSSEDSNKFSLSNSDLEYELRLSQSMFTTMNIKMLNLKMTSPSQTSPANMPQYPTIHNKVVSNTLLQPDLSTLFFLPIVILYKANVLADPNLWDSHFSPISLFGTNKFLLSQMVTY